MSMLNGSGVGVMIAATTKMINTAHLKCRIRKRGVTIPNCAMMKITTGSSNIKPSPSRIVIRSRSSRCAVRRQLEVAAHPEKELDHERKSDGVGERRAGQEEEGAEEHEGEGTAPLFAVEARGDEGPELVEDPRRSEEEGRQCRDLEVEEEGLGDAENGELLALFEVRANRALEEPVELLTEGPGDEEGHEGPDHSEQNPLAQLLEMLEQRHPGEFFAPASGRAGSVADRSPWGGGQSSRAMVPAGGASPSAFSPDSAGSATASLSCGSSSTAIDASSGTAAIAGRGRAA